jgi:4-hydroxy-3-polyprenylbenzoate decarboxylase
MSLPLVVGISGASGAIYGIRLLELLRDLGIASHLVLSRSAEITIARETEWKIAAVKALATEVHAPTDIAASISSGSFRTRGMIVAPCSIRSLSEIATGVTSSLLTRAADVTLKERRRLVLMVREAPFHLGHLRSMTAATEIGAIIYPPLPAFYARPRSLEEMVDQTLGRVLDLFDIPTDAVERWEGLGASKPRGPAADLQMPADALVTEADDGVDAASWEFALRLYACDGVAEACLRLQADDGLDVMLLMMTAFAAVRRGIVLAASEIAEIDAVCRPWREQVVRPLRALRTALKTGPAPAPNAASERLRSSIKAAELSAERQQNQALSAWLGSRPAQPRTVTRAELAAVLQAVVGFSSQRIGGTAADSSLRAIAVIAEAASALPE